MTNKELREYLERFKDEEEVSFVIADPKSRKAYEPEEVFVIFDENISNPYICIGVGQPTNLDEKAQEVARKDEIAAQPEFVRLRNNEQRKAFLKDYRSWPVWFTVPQAEETYCRYWLPDGSAIVMCEYKQYNAWWTNKYIGKDPETTYAAEYLLEPGYHHLHDCRTNETALIRKLMEVQK